MLYQNYYFEQSTNQIFPVLKDLQIAKLLYKANIRKGCSLSALEMFQRLITRKKMPLTSIGEGG